ncbi:MAG TPA: hypothetical protein VGQ28_04825 [Thermoanaerobaculia bacterium]|nr:hypothetical protein [Thermoanaerobaculia bacterium]
MLLRTAESKRWRRAFWVLLLLLVASYFYYDFRTGFTHGGSRGGIVYGALGTLAILILLYFGVRKRSYRSTWGTLEGWLQCHLYLGLLSAVLILFHTGFRFHDKVAIAAFMVLLAVVASGFWGAVVYTGVPRRLTEVEGDLAPAAMAEQLEQLGRTMARLATGRSAPFQKVCTGLLAEMVPERLAGWKLLFGGRSRKGGDAATPWAAELARVPAGEQDELRQLLVLARQRRELHQRLLVQQRYRNQLEVWLYLHLPLSLALVALVAAHLIAVFFFSKVLQ